MITANQRGASRYSKKRQQDPKEIPKNPTTRQQRKYPRVQQQDPKEIPKSPTTGPQRNTTKANSEKRTANS